MRTVSLRALAATSLLGLTAPVASHSWVEQLNRIAPNGTMIDPPGYISGFIPRTAPGFDDNMDVYLVPPNGRPTGNAILPTDLMCKSTQTVGNYSSSYPMLIAAPGDLVALRYEENGHVTKPWINPGKPENRGTVYIYGTTQPRSNDTLLGIHKVWNVNGTGGDGRGKLIATRNFDDGQCYQVNPFNISQARQKEFPKPAQNPQGTDLWCQTDIQLPQDAAPNSTYTIYWLWEWNTYNTSTVVASRDNNRKVAVGSSAITLNETYTSCMQIQMVDPCSEELGSVKSPSCSEGGNSKQAVSFIKGQDFNSAAIAEQLTNEFDVVPHGGGGLGEAGGNSSAAASSDASSNASPAASSDPASAASAASSPSVPAGVAVVTVTVTEDVATVYVTATVDVTATLTATQQQVQATSTVSPTPANAGASTPSGTGGHPSVSPFQRRAFKAPRRGLGGWQLGGQR